MLTFYLYLNSIYQYDQVYLSIGQDKTIGELFALIKNKSYRNDYYGNYYGRFPSFTFYRNSKCQEGKRC